MFCLAMDTLCLASQIQEPNPLCIVVHTTKQNTSATLIAMSVARHNINNFYGIYTLFNDKKCFKHSATISIIICIVLSITYNQHNNKGATHEGSYK